MYEKLSYKNRDKKKEEKIENLKTLFTISFVITDSLMIYDLVLNVIYKELDEFFYFRFFVAFFGLYGTLLFIGGYFLMEYCDCEFTCKCSKILDTFFSFCGCHLFLGGLFLIISYCVELCSILLYFKNKDKITEISIIIMTYLLFIFSSITVILLILIIFNKKNEKKLKQKND